jgi:hypothetical protein
MYKRTRAAGFGPGGPASHHARHLRPALGLLRRVLPSSKSGPDAGRARLCGGVYEVRCADDADLAGACRFDWVSASVTRSRCIWPTFIRSAATSPGSRGCRCRAAWSPKRAVIDHLPVGVQDPGPPLHDDKVLQVAASYQRITDWHKQRPQLLTRRRQGGSVSHDCSHRVSSRSSVSKYTSSSRRSEQGLLRRSGRVWRCPQIPTSTPTRSGCQARCRS